MGELNHFNCQVKFPIASSSSTKMAPVEIEIISRDVITPSVHMKIVEKAFELPLVTDTFNEVSKLARPLSPFVETMKNVATPYVEKFSPMVESGFITIKNAADLQLPEGTTANIQSKFDTAVENLDTLVCQGLDQLTTRVPALKEPTTELVETTRDTAFSCFGHAQEYFASFGISQIALKLGDKGLQIATDALTLTGFEKTKPLEPVVNGIKNIRRHARAVRRAGAKVAGIKPAKTIGEASLLGAVAEVFGMNLFLSVVGLQLVPANIPQKPTTGELDTTTEDETVDAKLSDEKIASYMSDEDPDFVPSGANEDSVEDDSEAEEAEDVVDEAGEVVEQTEVVEEIEEVLEEVKEVVEKTEAVLEKTEAVVEDIVEKVEEVVEEVIEKVEEVVDEVAETVVVAEKIEDIVEKVVEEIEEDVVKEVEDVVEKVVETIEDAKKIVDDVEEIGEVEEAGLAIDEDVVKEVEDVVEKVVETIEEAKRVVH